MNQSELERALANLPLGRIRFFETIGSTNDFAASWASQDAPDLSLVAADEQTRGRGRSGRHWFTPPGSALAFSLILRPGDAEPSAEISRATGLGALAVCQALEQNFNLQPHIKWPNDVLLDGKKICGVLAEAHWQGDQLLALIVGIGINVAPSSVPPDPSLNYPATSIESVLGKRIDRVSLLTKALEKLIEWRTQLASPEFITAWETRLAFRDQIMQITPEGQASMHAKITGLDDKGRLKLRLSSGEDIAIHAGEIQLRPLVDSSSNQNTLL